MYITGWGGLGSSFFPGGAGFLDNPPQRKLVCRRGGFCEGPIGLAFSCHVSTPFTEGLARGLALEGFGTETSKRSSI